MKKILITLIVCANFVKASEQAASASSSHEEEIASPGNEEQEEGGSKEKKLTHEASVKLGKKLETAIWLGDPVQVGTLIAQGAPINGIKSRKKYGPKAEPALYVAAQRGNTDMVQFLIDMKADPNVRSFFQSIPVVFEACTKPEILRILLEAKGNPNAHSFGWEAIETSIRFRTEECTTLLLKYGAEIKHQKLW